MQQSQKQEKQKAKTEKNTDAWKKKQQEKKNKKQGDGKESKKDKKKKDKMQKDMRKDMEKGKKQDEKEKGKGKEQDEKGNGKERGEGQRSSINNNKSSGEEEPHSSLLTVDSVITAKHPQLSRNRHHQKQLLYKYVSNFCSRSDSVVLLGDDDWQAPCEQLNIAGFNSAASCELVCRYCDLSYFMESHITKIFVSAIVIFGNGSILAKKGSLNAILLGCESKVPVVACGGSWNYSGYRPFSQDCLHKKYGSQLLDKYDLIQAADLFLIVLQAGSVLPQQVASLLQQIYRQYGIQGIKW